jgi:mRNA interferase MazF
VLIVQSEALLDAEHPSTLIAPMTTNRIDNAEPLRLHVKARPGLDQDSDLLLDQLRAIDNKRLIQGPLLQLSGEQMRAVNEALREVLGITEI